MPNMMKGQMRIISTRIVSQVAMRYDLLEVNKKYKKLQKQYDALFEDYKNLQEQVKSTTPLQATELQACMCCKQQGIDPKSQ